MQVFFRHVYMKGVIDAGKYSKKGVRADSTRARSEPKRPL